MPGLDLSTPLLHDIGKLFAGKVAFDPLVVTAGTAGNGADAFGLTIDRFALKSKQVFSGKAQVPFRAVLGAHRAVTVTLRCQHSIDGAVWTDYVYRPSGVPQVPGSKTVSDDVAGTGAGGTYDDLAELDIDFDGAHRYVRIAVNPTLTAPGADAVALGAGILNFTTSDLRAVV